MGLFVVGCNEPAPSDDGVGSQSSSGITVTAGTVDTGDTDPTGSPTTTIEPTSGTSEAPTTGDSTTTSEPTDGTTGSASSSSGDEDTSDASADDGESTDSTTGDVVPCDIADATLEPLPPNIMLVLDKSGSMVVNTWDHDANGNTPPVTRWNSLHQVVDFVVTTFDSQINFGAKLFPAETATNDYSSQACVVANVPEIPVASMNANAILAGIPGATDVDLAGGTPATAGILVAKQHLLTLDPTHPRAIVFVTDGAANCRIGARTSVERFEEYDSQLPVEVGNAWTNAGIPTYVVGIDIENAVSPVVVDGNPDSTNPYEKLNEVATAGGKPKAGAEKFYQTTNQIELQDALQQIIDDALSCSVPLNPVPAFPDLLEIYIDGMMVPRVTDCNTEDGWVYTNPNGPYDSIELCGSWCAELKVTGALKAEYYCDPG